MRSHFVCLATALAALALLPVARAQTGPAARGTPGGAAQATREKPPAQETGGAGENQNIHLDGWDRSQQPIQTTGKKPGPAPVHDISGIWEPIPGYRDGVMFTGPRDMPSDPQHEALMPYTPMGKQLMLSHKTGFGTNIAPVTEINDPFDTCDPIGFPRIELFNLRAVQIVQTKDQVLMLYQNTRTFRTIWTDGRALPKDITELRWFGYSVGKWVDKNTLVVTTTGLDDSTWIDNAGRPHSTDLVVEETFHRVDEFNLDLSMKITDPQMYTKPWFPLKNFRLGMNSPNFDIREMICSVSQQALYNQLYKDADAQGEGNPTKSDK